MMSIVSETNNLISTDSESSLVYSSEDEANATIQNLSNERQTDDLNGFNSRHSAENNIRIASSHAIQVGDVVNNIRSTTPSAGASVRLPINDDVKLCCTYCNKFIVLSAAIIGFCFLFVVFLVSMHYRSYDVQMENFGIAFNKMLGTFPNMTDLRQPLPTTSRPSLWSRISERTENVPTTATEVFYFWNGSNWSRL